MTNKKRDNFPVTSDVSLKTDMVLMRYLDLAKFIDLISTKTLYVASAVEFEDSLEGTLPEQMREMYEKNPDVIKQLGSLSILEKEQENRIKNNVSCWTKGPKDNMALWKIYGASKQSIAIITTLEKLIQSTFLWCDITGVTFKEVAYIDHSGRLPDGIYTLSYDTFGLKHEAYEFEKEVRMVVTRSSLKQPSPLRLKIKPNDIIEKIIISPEAGEWFFDLVKSVSKKYRISAPVEYSKLTELINKSKMKN
ncbi:hypothetical protein FCL47_17085 [Desulfopila sp. IMCC35006]|uniref:hypothetical protein n=1 Tax=Desulfopila sp. IMCC35006 TaxID=2569542 RepID=UPI0010AC3947|nr:hypothetical protein [Desulfopila sp. IMCC35006]TKB24555.1 hypothetical protein FCL47_17085 [Desulfopila sp. IMCC35006]